MLEDDIDIAFPGNFPDRLAEAASFLRPLAEFRRVNRWHLSPALEIFAVDDSLGAEVENVFNLRLVLDNPDGVGAGRGDKLDAEHTEPAGGAPHQNVVARLKRVRRMPEQHPIRGRKRKRVASRLFPREMVRLRHQLAELT